MRTCNYRPMARRKKADWLAKVKHQASPSCDVQAKRGETLRACAKAHDAVVDDIVEYCARRGWPCTPTDASVTFNRSGGFMRRKVATGWPDITIALPPFGKAFFVEVKTGSAKPRKGQGDCIAELRAAGATVLVLGSLAEFIAQAGRFFDDQV